MVAFRKWDAISKVNYLNHLVLSNITVNGFESLNENQVLQFLLAHNAEMCSHYPEDVSGGYAFRCKLFFLRKNRNSEPAAARLS